MAKVFITGSADGLGKLAGEFLVNQGHQVFLHARNKARGQVALNNVPGAEGVLLADLSNTKACMALAKEVNSLGPFDSIIHNAGVYRASSQMIFAVNTLAPYLLTCLIQKPKRLIFVSSGMHLQGNASLKHFNPNQTSYSDSKLFEIILTKVVSRYWTDVLVNAVNPGWVPTKMGGLGAPDDLKKGFESQVWLATSSDSKANVSGYYFYHQKKEKYHPIADDVPTQEALLLLCEEMTGVKFPVNL